MYQEQKILIIDDEPQIRKLLRFALEAENYQVETAGTSQEGLRKIIKWKPDLIILDLTLPDGNGDYVLNHVREWNKAPVIVLTATSSEEDKVRLLDSGADDYITKPFGTSELLARIRTAFRHISANQTNQPVFKTGRLQVDFSRRIVTVDGNDVHLTPIEYNLLSLLAQNPGKVITSHHIMKTIWGPGMEIETGYLRIYILQLRKKIEVDPADPKIIVTEPGIGYRLIAE